MIVVVVVVVFVLDSAVVVVVVVVVVDTPEEGVGEDVAIETGVGKGVESIYK